MTWGLILLNNILTYTLIIILGGCASKQTITKNECPAGRTKLDNICVSEDIADYVSCVRARGFNLKKKKRDYLSAEVGYIGISATGASEINEILTKNYSSSKDETLSIIAHCGKSLLSNSEAVQEDKVTLKTPLNASLHWVSSPEYKTKFKQKVKERFYPKKVEGRCTSNSTQYRPQFIPYPTGKFYFYSYHGQSSEQFKTKNHKLQTRGFTLISNSHFKCAGKIYHQGTLIKT
jgi:hypothetical protein